MNNFEDQYLIAYIKSKYTCIGRCNLHMQGFIILPRIFVKSTDVVCKQCGRMFTHEESFGEDKGWATSWEIEDYKDERLALDTRPTSE